MARAISFGLVHIPVSLVSATSSGGIGTYCTGRVAGAAQCGAMAYR